MRYHLFMICMLLFLTLGASVAFAKVEAQLTDADFDAEFADDFNEEVEAPLINDPLESWNRGVFWINDKLYFYALKPVARVFRVVPSPARKGTTWTSAVASNSPRRSGST